jgi:hypothetical protein
MQGPIDWWTERAPEPGSLDAKGCAPLRRNENDFRFLQAWLAQCSLGIHVCMRCVFAGAATNFYSANQTLSQTNLAPTSLQTNHAKSACIKPGSCWPGSDTQPGLSHPTNHAPFSPKQV